MNVLTTTPPSTFGTACGPLGTEDISWLKYVFQQIYRWSILPGPVVGRILDSGRFAGLEFAGLHYLAHFEGKRPGDDSQQFDRTTYVHRCGIGPASGGIHPQNLPIVLLPPTKKAAAKNNEV